MEPQFPHRFRYDLKYAFLFSVPSFILSVIIVLLVRKISTSQPIRKLILSLAGVALTAAPLYLIDGGLQILESFIAYSSIILIGIWVYPLSAINMEDGLTEST